MDQLPVFFNLTDRWVAVLVEPSAHEADGLPVLLSQSDAFALRGRFGEVLAPLRGIDEIALGVGRNGAGGSIAGHFNIPCVGSGV